ncbi:Ser-Thr-rich glycosyl-phosphatidyl-inositol-anchored membrane family-domain-containing protein [Hypoxylon sp. FL1284]|nr:Ser-Thr-rich glycosyl-phosphatidyl-inositol-anchored membrane family-domain-containing protein [Hypoxylon sp. FL1284]
MRSTAVFASALAFAASAFAQTDGYAAMTSPTDGEKVASGKTFTIKWEAGKYTGPATISLLGGDSPTTLVPGATIATVDVTDGSFDWPVDCSLGKEKTYGIKITSVDHPKTFQYSFPFSVSGPSCSSGAGAGPSSGAGSYPVLSSSSASEVSSSSTSAPSSSSAVTSSSAFTSAPSYPTAPVSSSSVASNYSTVSPIGNLSTTAVPTYAPTTVLTSTSAVAVPTASSTSAPVPLPTSGANTAAAGSIAFVGALAFAVMAL